MNHVLAVLPRGEAIRTHVYSRALDRLAARGELTVASVRPNDAVWALLEAQLGDVVALATEAEPWRVRIIRELLDTAHGRWLWSEAAKERWRRRGTEVASVGKTVKLKAKRALAYPLANAAALRALDAVYERVVAASRQPGEVDSLLSSRPFRLVFNASHVHSRNAEALVAAGRRGGIRTATFLFSWDNLTSQGRIVPRYDRYLAWNEDIKRDLLRLYPTVRDEHVVVTGTPQFDFHFWPELRQPRAEWCASVGADPSRPIVLYTTGMPNHMPGEPAIVEHVADTLRTLDDLGPPQLLVRVYAKDRSGRFEDLARRRTDIVFTPTLWERNWLTPLPEDTELWTNTLLHCDVGINVASTVSLELCIFDKPVVNVAYNPPSVSPRQIDYARYYSFDHYRPVAESGAIALARRPEEIAKLVRDAIEHPSRAARARRALLDRMFGPTLDGHAADRVGESLSAFAEGR